MPLAEAAVIHGVERARVTLMGEILAVLGTLRSRQAVLSCLGAAPGAIGRPGAAAVQLAAVAPLAGFVLVRVVSQTRMVVAWAKHQPVNRVRQRCRHVAVGMIGVPGVAVVRHAVVAL